MGAPNALNRATEPNESATSICGSTRCASGIGAAGAGAPNQPAGGDPTPAGLIAIWSTDPFLPSNLTTHDGGEAGVLPTSCADRLGIQTSVVCSRARPCGGRKTGVPGSRRSLARIPRNRELLSLYQDRRQSLRNRR